MERDALPEMHCGHSLYQDIDFNTSCLRNEPLSHVAFFDRVELYDVEFSKSAWRHQNLNCLTVNPRIKRIPDSDCALKIIESYTMPSFYYQGNHNFQGSKTS